MGSKKLHFLLYLFRWQASAFVMMPFIPLVYSTTNNLYLALMMLQFIGSLIFYKPDEALFVKDSKSRIVLKKVWVRIIARR